MSPPERLLFHASDGAMLHAEALHPPGPARATLLLGHAMMASRRTFHRGLAPLLRDRGFRVVTFDFRGHGQSGPLPSEGGDAGYDDHVRLDLPSLRRQATSLWPGPLAVVGHSLGAHAAVASQGAGLLGADALVLLAGNIWMPSLEPSARLRALKSATFRAAWAVTRRAGFFPTRALRLGSEDESRSLFRGFLRWWQDDGWGSADGRLDYISCAARVRCPTLAVAGAGDSLECTPGCARRFLDLLGGPRRDLVVMGRGPLAGFAPAHMPLVTDPRSAPAWRHLASWLDQHLPPA